MKKNINNQIMIVGRDSHFLYLMQRFARTSTHRALSVNLGDDVLALARCEKPLVIVLEMDQPETAGWRTLRTLKADPEICKIPIIICSWLDEEMRSLAEGAACHLRMPILYTDFEAALATVLMKEQYE